jgi:DNA-3-methyladenine glycosylase II
VIVQLDRTLLNESIDAFCVHHKSIKKVVSSIGYPDLYFRKANFETLVKLILEQQVSLASARSAYEKLKAKVKRITPKNILDLSDEDLKACYFSRQKTVYVRALSTAILTKQLDLKGLEKLDDEAVKETLMSIKGIGHWTAEVYLLQALKRPNHFPLGDVAAMNAAKEIFGVSDREKLIKKINQFSPNKTSLVFLAWYYYIKKKNLKVIL